MKVYALLYDEHDGDDPLPSALIGVYSSLDCAKEAAKTDCDKARRRHFGSHLKWVSHSTGEEEPCYAEAWSYGATYKYAIYPGVLQ